MIGYIKGKVLSFSEGKVLIENNGIGYEVFCSAEAEQSLVGNGEGELYTYLNVTQEGIALYGFANAEEKEMFLKLITVSGVGAKMGVGILSGMKTKELERAISLGDVKTLSTVKGLGKKTAERIILELKDKVGLAIGDMTSSSSAPITALTDEDEDAVSALVGLGFARAESVRVVKEAKANGLDTVQKIIPYALKHIK